MSDYACDECGRITRPAPDEVDSAPTRPCGWPGCDGVATIRPDE